MGVGGHEEEGQVGRHEEGAKGMASDSRLLSLSCSTIEDGLNRFIPGEN